MFKKLAYVVTAVVMISGVLLAGVPAALADGGETLTPVYDEDQGWMGCIVDGRLNGCQVDAPFGVFYTYNTVQALDDDGDLAWNSDGSPAYVDEVDGVEVWGVASGYENLTKVIAVSKADVQAAIAAGGDVVISQAMGYSFGYSATGYFWITAPTGYSFVWEALDLLS